MWPIDRDVAQTEYTVKSRPNHVWLDPNIHPPHRHESSHLLSRAENLLKLQPTKHTNLKVVIYKVHVTTTNIHMPY